LHDSSCIVQGASPPLARTRARPLIDLLGNENEDDERRDVHAPLRERRLVS